MTPRPVQPGRFITDPSRRTLLRSEVLVRGSQRGGLRVAGLRGQIEVCYKHRNLRVFGFSVFTQADMNAQQIAQKIGLTRDPNPLWHPYLCETTVAKVVEAGWKVAMTDQRSFGHATIYFPTKPSDEDIERIIETFDDPKINQGTQDEFR